MQTFQVDPSALFYRQIGFSPDGRWLALAGKSLVLLDTTGQEPLAELPTQDVRFGFAFVRGGTAVVSLRRTQDLCECELVTRQTREHKIAVGYAYGIAADRSGDTLYLAVRGPKYGDKSSIRLMNADTLEFTASFAALPDPMRGVKLSGDGRWVSAVSYRRVRAWNIGTKLPTRAAVLANTDSDVRDFGLSADGGHLVIVSTKGLEIWNTRSGGHMRSGKHKRAVPVVACHPTKPVLATGDNGGQIFLWDYSGNVLTRYDWALGEVCALAFAPDGLRCAAVDAKGKVVIWDVDA